MYILLLSLSQFLSHNNYIGDYTDQHEFIPMHLLWEMKRRGRKKNVLKRKKKSIGRGDIMKKKKFCYRD